MHLESIERQTGHCPEQLREAPGLSNLVGHVWETFLTLHENRSGDSRIAVSDIIGLISLTGFPLEVWEIEAIWKLDSLWLKMKNEHFRRCHASP